jgi:hypothetical protein
MEQLTAQQALMVIEYFAGQAAEDAPAVHHGDNETARDAFNKHVWLTHKAVCIALEREVNAHDWHGVIVNMIDLQSFDRDPEGYLNERGYTEKDRDYMHGVLEDLVSWAIDEVHNNSKVDW